MMRQELAVLHGNMRSELEVRNQTDREKKNKAKKQNKS
jgi:hypothetical protein